MNIAYKQEKKKNAKRRTHNVPSMTFKDSDPLFGAGDSPSPKRLKESLYLSFPVETVLATEQSGSEDIKTELAYRLAESDVHWGGRCVTSVEQDYMLSAAAGPGRIGRESRCCRNELKNLTCENRIRHKTWQEHWPTCTVGLSQQKKQFPLKMLLTYLFSLLSYKRYFSYGTSK